jgi:1-acyl-sn-glycerol-3-phosphate acyltransferase
MNESGSNDQGGAGGKSTWRWRHGPRKLFTIAMSLTYWMIGGLLFVLVGLICAPLLPRVKSQALGQWLLQRAFRLYLLLLRFLNVLKVEHHGIEKLQRATGGLILAPNHPAMWDVVCIISRIHGLRCILKASLMQNPMLIGGGSKFPTASARRTSSNVFRISSTPEGPLISRLEPLEPGAVTPFEA